MILCCYGSELTAYTYTYMCVTLQCKQNILYLTLTSTMGLYGILAIGPYFGDRRRGGGEGGFTPNVITFTLASCTVSETTQNLRTHYCNE